MPPRLLRFDAVFRGPGASSGRPEWPQNPKNRQGLPEGDPIPVLLITLGVDVRKH